MGVKPPLILASASPRRAMLLREAGYEFRVMPSPVEEPRERPAGLSPAQWAEHLSAFKAEQVAAIVSAGLILAADTVTVLGDQIFGKPEDRADARRILTSLCGTAHEVMTGITLLDAASRTADTRHDTTRVVMRRISETELESYLDSGAWNGKAGAYGIQDQDDPFVESIDGSFSNVVGLPMELLQRMLS